MGVGPPIPSGLDDGWGVSLDPSVSVKLFRCQLSTNRTGPCVIFSVVGTEKKRVYFQEEFWYLLFLHVNRESSDVPGELSEESVQFRFIRASCWDNLKGSIGLTLTKASTMRVTIPLDSSTRSFIPLPRFFFPLTFRLFCAIGRRPKADNFGSNRGKREKDFWEEFLSLGVTNNTQEQEGKRTFSFSQLQVVKRGV